jgi:hypothetical protein
VRGGALGTGGGGTSGFRRRVSDGNEGFRQEGGFQTAGAGFGAAQRGGGRGQVLRATPRPAPRLAGKRRGRQAPPEHIDRSEPRRHPVPPLPSPPRLALGTSVRFHWPMQGPHALASTVPPTASNASISPSRAMVARICSLPGVMQNGTCGGGAVGGHRRRDGGCSSANAWRGPGGRTVRPRSSNTVRAAAQLSVRPVQGGRATAGRRGARG